MSWMGNGLKHGLIPLPSVAEMVDFLRWGRCLLIFIFKQKISTPQKNSRNSTSQCPGIGTTFGHFKVVEASQSSSMHTARRVCRSSTIVAPKKGNRANPIGGIPYITPFLQKVSLVAIWTILEAVLCKIAKKGEGGEEGWCQGHFIVRSKHTTTTTTTTTVRTFVRGTLIVVCSNWHLLRGPYRLKECADLKA